MLRLMSLSETGSSGGLFLVSSCFAVKGNNFCFNTKKNQ